MSKRKAFLDRFKGRVSSIPKGGVEEIITQSSRPIDKKGWREYLRKKSREEAIEGQEKDDGEKEIRSEIRKIDKFQSRVLPKLSKKSSD